MKVFKEAYWNKFQEYLQVMGDKAIIAIKIVDVKIKYPPFWRRLFNSKIHPNILIQVKIGVKSGDEWILDWGTAYVSEGGSIEIQEVPIDFIKLIYAVEEP